ncbi:MAG: hypothetical protein AAF664_05145 [Planctomycetota bacterium]
MFRRTFNLIAIFGLVAGLSPVGFAHDSLRSGDALGAFRVTKIAGADEDGVSEGETLCYRCRYGSSPMVLAFVRSDSVDLKPTITALNELLSQHEDDRLRGLVAFYGDQADALRARAESLSSKVSDCAAPIVVTSDAAAGPANYRLPEDHDVTIVTAIDSQVVSVEHFDGSVDFDRVAASIKSAISES